MIPKEKAKELVLKFAFKGAQHEGEAKTFALIAVDEVLDALEEHQWQNRHIIEDYKLVKQELENYE